MGGYAKFFKSDSPELDITLVRLLVREVLKDAALAAKRGEHIDYARVQVHRREDEFPDYLQDENSPEAVGIGYYFGTLPASFVPPDEQDDPVYAEYKGETNR